MHPSQIRVIDKAELFLKWDDGSESTIPLSKLRKLCPCATCMTERNNQSETYIPLYHSDQIKILEIKAVGNYALAIHWADGHNTGIYEYPFLKNLSENINV